VIILETRRAPAGNAVFCNLKTKCKINWSGVRSLSKSNCLFLVYSFEKCHLQLWVIQLADESNKQTRNAHNLLVGSNSCNCSNDSFLSQQNVVISEVLDSCVWRHYQLECIPFCVLIFCDGKRLLTLSTLYNNHNGDIYCNFWEHIQNSAQLINERRN